MIVFSKMRAIFLYVLYYLYVKIMTMEKQNDTSLQALSLYRKELSNVDNTDPNLQKQLISEAKKGNMDAAEKLISAHLKLVYKTAAKYCNNDEQLLLDLIQEGNLGLVIAMQKYDESKGNSFTTYALFWIEKYILAYLNENRLIRIPTGTARDIKKLKKVINDLQQQLSHYPTIEEIAENSCFDKQQINRLLSLDYQFSSIDQNESLSQLTTDNDTVDIDKMVLQLIDTLDDPKDKEILKLYLGIECEKSLTFKQIGEKFNITGQAVRARYLKAIKKIKEYYE